MGKRIFVSVGERFGRLVVLEELSINGVGRLRCLCDCGNETTPTTSNVYKGFTKGCGCRIKVGHQSHGMRNTREYRSWNMMTQRCSNKNNHAFKNYGGRGIRVCAEWLIFENFYKDMGPRPTDTSIDRIDVNGNYEPSNCRWADAITQANNKRIKMAVSITQ
jgi:hypothetical protein